MICLCNSWWFKLPIACQPECFDPRVCDLSVAGYLSVYMCYVC